MNKHFSQHISTQVLLEQARMSQNLLKAPAMREGRDGIAAAGLKVEAFSSDLAQAIEDGQNSESAQERLKQRYIKEAHDDQDLAKLGYRWVLQLQARVRFAMTSMPEDLDLPGRLRFGQLRVPRARGVVYHLRIILPELETLRDQLAPYGLDADFIAQGHKILADLGIDRAETAEAKAEREAMTRQVRKAEKRLDQLLSMLDAADEAASLARPDARRFFKMEIIHAELARQDAQRLLHQAALPADKASELIHGE